MGTIKLKKILKNFEAPPYSMGSEGADLPEALTQVGMCLILLLATLIGLWGFTCLASGVIQSGGVVELISEWVKALQAGK